MRPVSNRHIHNHRTRTITTTETSPGNRVPLTSRPLTAASAALPDLIYDMGPTTNPNRPH